MLFFLEVTLRYLRVRVSLIKVRIEAIIYFLDINVAKRKAQNIKIYLSRLKDGMGC